MNLNQLETFVHVAEHGSFSKAALVLGIALAEDAIRPSQHLKRLAVTPIVQPGIKITLCLVTPAQRRATPLRQRAAGLLVQLMRGA